MNDNTVCGYANFETFTMVMEITNNRGREYLERWQKIGQEVLAKVAARQREEECFTIPERATLSFADLLKAHFERYIPECPDWQSCLLSHAFGQVYWLEVAQELLPEGIA